MGPRRSLRGAWPVLTLALAACAAPDAEIHLAPLFSRHTAPGYDRAEAAGGILRREEDEDGRTWALSPLVWHRRDPGGQIEADFLYPFGRYEEDPDRPRTYARLFPIFWREAETRPDGVVDRDWMLFPLFGGGSSDGREDYLALFPLIGRTRNFLTYDEWSFVLWPLWSRTEKDGRRHTQILWPLFGWRSGNGAAGWHAWPVYGRSELAGKYRRSWFLWPVFRRTDEGLDRRHPLHGWLLMPLGGRIREGDYTATTVLWPVFGWAERPSTGYSAWRVWPLLKFESKPSAGQELGQVLPFWLHFRSEATEYGSILWPIFWWRHDTIDGRETTSFLAAPIWFASRTRHPDGGEDRRWKLWPLAAAGREADGGLDRAVLSPGLDPLLSSAALRRNLGFVFELWSDRRRDAAAPRTRRAWLDLYHSVEAGGHRRWSLPVLGGRWTEPDGTKHTSLLFGLIRWRSGPDGTAFEDPAFPGPGWPDLHAAVAASE
ncbi:MAG: hypothetical protein D6702_10060 [Planctomycetota bacterium]|nr:MAG: hypothetical protein D6702_10060 [Planctomycetota bacterium]